MRASLLKDCPGGEYHPSAPRLRSGPSAEETEQVTGDEWYESDENAAEPAEAENSEYDETGYYETDEGTAGARDANFVSSPSWDGGTDTSPDPVWTGDDGEWGDDSGQTGTDGEEGPGDASCNNEVDDDANNTIDDCNASKAEELRNCANGVDDDGNGLTDYTFDSQFCVPGGVGELPNCANTVDDDGNEFQDGEDSKCWSGGSGEIPIGGTF